MQEFRNFSTLKLKIETHFMVKLFRGGRFQAGLCTLIWITTLYYPLLLGHGLGPDARQELSNNLYH